MSLVDGRISLTRLFQETMVLQKRLAKMPEWRRYPATPVAHQQSGNYSLEKRLVIGGNDFGSFVEQFLNFMVCLFAAVNFHKAIFCFFVSNRHKSVDI